MSEFDPRRVQQALVCMLFDPKYAARVRGREPLPELGERERELLRGVDPRALATDEMRRARALHVILDEYPVSAALLGIDGVDRFFSSPGFRACVFERGSMALGFGEGWLRDRTKGVGAIETGLARARRELLAASAEASEGIRRAPGVIPLRVPDGTLAWYRRARERLGAEPLQALTKLRKPWPQKPPRRGQQHLLIEPQADGSLGIATASAALVELLEAGSKARPRAELAKLAIELGAEPHEADELLDELLGDKLLCDR
ncbi:MAG: hypothetical protein R6X02_29660 [Enhygromyxa sp.]